MAPVPIIRNSERKDLKRCPFRWWWGWREGLRPIGETSDALWFGTGVHIGLAGWYCGPGLKRGPHPAETFDAWSGDELRYIKTSNKYGDGAEALIEEKLVPARELGLVLLDEYVKRYGQDEHMYIIQPEKTFQLDLMNGKLKLAIFAGTYDLVWRNLITDMIWLEEHKTAKAIVTEHLPLDDQAGSYWAVAAQDLRNAKLIGPKERLQGIEYNFLRKAMPDTRPRDADGHYTNLPIKQDYIQAFTDWSIDASHATVASALGLDASRLGKLTLEQLEQIAVEHELRVLGKVSKQQPAPLFVRHPVKRTARERATQIQHIKDEHAHMMAYRRGELPLIKHTTRECQWDCSFYHMCLLHEGDADWEQYRDAMYFRQDPYADHRKSTEE